jgi:hypothetical protein
MSNASRETSGRIGDLPSSERSSDGCGLRLQHLSGGFDADHIRLRPNLKRYLHAGGNADIEL